MGSSPTTKSHHEKNPPLRPLSVFLSLASALHLKSQIELRSRRRKLVSTEEIDHEKETEGIVRGRKERTTFVGWIFLLPAETHHHQDGPWIAPPGLLHFALRASSITLLGFIALIFLRRRSTREDSALMAMIGSTCGGHRSSGCWPSSCLVPWPSSPSCVSPLSFAHGSGWSYGTGRTTTTVPIDSSWRRICNTSNHRSS